jgi:methyl-accepting chemotaxis protein
MRSPKNRVTLIVIGIVALVTMVVILVFHLQAKPILLMNMENKANRDIAVAEAIIDLKYPGSWQGYCYIIVRVRRENRLRLLPRLKWR